MKHVGPSQATIVRTDTDSLPLPGVLAEIASVTSREVALRLAGAKGGRRVYLPRAQSLTDDHWLVKLVGPADADTICRHFWFADGSTSRAGNERGHGTRVDIPSAGAIQRRDAVRFMSIAGASISDMAKALHISERYVTMIRAQLRVSGEI